MKHCLFNQSELPDPYVVYEEMLQTTPLYFDETNQIWVAYSYEHCQFFLNSEKVAIPTATAENLEILNPTAQRVRKNLVRLNNLPTHGEIRPIISLLFNKIRGINPKALLDQLLADQNLDQLDWVNQVCKKLPPLSVLSGFNFNQEQTTYLLGHVGTLVKVMNPTPPETVAKEINAIIDDVYQLIETHLTNIGLIEDVVSATDRHLPNNQIRELAVSNLIGFLIQSYDAGRGLLSNALLDQFEHGSYLPTVKLDASYFKKLTTESLRHNPSVQNTKRVVTKPITLNGSELRVGQIVLIVLAAANRDPKIFKQPADFNIERKNNDQHLTFGTGAHACLAKHFITHVTSEALNHLSKCFPATKLLSHQVEYEPLVNVRLPKEIKLCLSEKE